MKINIVGEEVNSDLLDALVNDWERERPDLDASAMHVVGRVIRLAEIMRASAHQALKRFDLHYTDFDVLATLRRAGHPFTLTPTELSQSVLLTSGAMTAALGRLERKGLIERRPEERDGRIRTVILSGAGKDLIEDAVAHRFADAQRNLTGLKPSQKRELTELLRELSSTLDCG